MYLISIRQRSQQECLVSIEGPRVFCVDFQFPIPTTGIFETSGTVGSFLPGNDLPLVALMSNPARYSLTVLKDFLF